MLEAVSYCVFMYAMLTIHVCSFAQDVKTIQHMQSVNLKKYQVTSVDDALAVIEENGDSMPNEASRGTASLERGLSLSTRGAHAVQLSQKGKKDTLFFTLGVSCSA